MGTIVINGLTIRRCPRCGGHLYLDKDCYVEGGLFSWYEYESCIQCGYISYPEAILQNGKESVESNLVQGRVSVGAGSN